MTLRDYLLESKEYYILILILVTVLLGGIFVLTANQVPGKPEIVVQELPKTFLTIADLLGKGGIGELEGEQEEEGSLDGHDPLQEFPSVVFDTSGRIEQVKSDHLVVQGSGSNFEDKKPRTLALMFNESTIVMKLGAKDKYFGLEGLEHLRSSMDILIQGEGNIRGKTKFTISYIYIE